MKVELVSINVCTELLLHSQLRLFIALAPWNFIFNETSYYWKHGFYSVRPPLYVFFTVRLQLAMPQSCSLAQVHEMSGAMHM